MIKRILLFLKSSEVVKNVKFGCVVLATFFETPVHLYSAGLCTSLSFDIVHQAVNLITFKIYGHDQSSKLSFHIFQSGIRLLTDAIIFSAFLAYAAI